MKISHVVNSYWPNSTFLKQNLTDSDDCTSENPEFLSKVVAPGGWPAVQLGDQGGGQLLLRQVLLLLHPLQGQFKQAGRQSDFEKGLKARNICCIETELEIACSKTVRPSSSLLLMALILCSTDSSSSILSLNGTVGTSLRLPSCISSLNLESSSSTTAFQHLI